MEKNYISKRSIKNSLKIVLIAFVFFSNIGINSVYAQACPVLTGPVYSKPDDIVITTYHSSIALGNGKFLTWGEDMAPDGTDQSNIIEITPANGYTYTGTPLMFALSGNSGAQAFLLTTTGLWTWGGYRELTGYYEVVEKPIVVDPGGGWLDGEFTSMTLPTGVTPADVLDIKANSDVFFLVTTSGNVWVTGGAAEDVTGNANTAINVWHQVETSIGVPLTGVVELTGSREVVYVRKADNSLWAWGDGIALGGGASVQDATYATQMNLSNLPSGVKLTQLGTYMDDASNTSGLLALGSDGKVYGVGYSGNGRLINTGTGFVSDWTPVKDNGGVNDIENAVFVSTSENSEEYATAAVITTAGAFNNLYTWGEADSFNIGHADGIVENPAVPSGFTPGTDQPVWVSVGGHATSYLNYANGGTICFVGHITGGSDAGAGGVETSFTCFGPGDANWPAGAELCIQSANAFPLAVDYSPSDIVENTGLINIDVLANDSFGNDGPNNGSITAITLNTGGAGSAFLNDNGTATDPTDDSIDFIPAFGYFGPVNIDYTITDADGDPSTATVVFNVTAGEPIICGPINTLYQTVGNTTPGKTDIFRYNNFQQSYVKVGELGGTATDDSAPNSAYNAATQLVYSSEPSDGGSIVRVYDPAANYSYIGNINITGNSQNFNNTLFAQGNFIGYVNNNKVIRFDVTNISSYPATIPVNEVTIAGATGANDYTLIGDEIYGVTGTTLRILNLATNSLVDRIITFDNTLDGVVNDNSFGAAWQDRNGNFYCFNNGNGGIYKITDVVNPASTVAVKVLLASPSGKNDGFGCELGPDPLDWDDDGISNSVDIDDDNDGILDINESNGTGIDPGGDDDNDGVFNFRDPDIAGYVDVNGDTINDNFDFDLDGVPDAFDLDSDNDGIPDNIEAQTTSSYVAPSVSDDDNDGLDNNYDSNDGDITPAISIGLLVIDTDSASDPGSPDFLDVDADNDGIYDTVEAGLMLNNADIDFDGLDDAVDSNLTNATDSNGTINDPTLLPDTNIGGDVDFREIADFDNDGVDNITDLDDDNDGILDTVEYPVGLTPFGDEDGDGIFNYADAIDNGTGDGSLTDYTNTNGDTIPDAYDFDLDGIVNHLDTDSDGDGCSDANEAYASSDADAGDGEQFGLGDPLTLGEGEVDTSGTVVTAVYTAPANLDSTFGNTDADFLQLSIIPNVITLDPVDISAIPFANISFTSAVSVTGTGTAVQYQWQEQVDGAGAWNDIADDITTYSGATTTTLGITAVNSTLDGNLYRLQVYSPAYICDTDVFSAAALLTITENNITAINDNGSGIEGTASTVVSNVLANDDLAGVTPTTATVILTEVSSTSAEVTLDTATGAVSVSAAATAGTYSIVYQICETTSPTNCTTAEITVVVNDQGNPIAVNDAVLIAEGTTTSTLINAIGNDNTQDNTNYLIGSLVYSSGNGATITDNDNGTFGYIPTVGFSGTDTFTYTICDDDSPTASCDTATVTITVADTGNPIAVNDEISILEGTTTSTLINAIGNDNLADNATYSAASLDVTGTTGTVTDNNNGTFGYIPVAGFSGIDTFTYTICDNDATPTCDTATVTIIVVDSGNPIAVDDSVLIAEGTVLATSIDALSNDNLADNAIYNTGSLVYSSGNGATVIYNGTSGEFEYTPAVGFSGTDTFTYTICDDDAIPSCDTATVTIAVADTGNPIAVNDEISIPEGTTTSTLINAIGNDNLADNTTYSSGSLDVTGTTGTVTDNNDGTFGYIPAVGFSGIDTFTYTICDDDGTPTCDTATVTIIVVDSGNPIAVDDSILIAEGTVSITSIDALANDNLADNAIYNTGSLVYSSGNGATVIYNGTSGEFEYTPAVGFSGTDTFTYTICDDDATPTCDTATVTIIVVDSGNPIAVDDSVIINEDTTVATIINVLANDNLVDNAAYSAGSLDVTGTIGTVTDNGDGTFDYIPAAGFAGLDTFTYTICDDDAIPTCDKATVFITVLDEGNPFANNDSAITILNTVVTTGNVLTNDTVVDNATITSFDVTSAKGGTITDNGGGTFNYTPPFGFIGVDSFTYTLCDDDVATASCTTATVFVTVLAGTSNLITTKTVSNSTPDEGQTITYTLTVTNNGPNAASNVSLTDLLPNGVTYTGNIPSQGVYNPGSGIWTVGDIAFPGNATITIDSTVDANTSNDLITNTTTAAIGDQSDPTTVGDDLVEAITVNNVADIVLTMVVDNNNPNVGDTVTYTVTVTNNGPVKVTSLVVTDVLPTGLTYGIVSPSDGTWTAPNWSVGILESGEEETIVIEAVVGMDQGGATLINVASNTQDQVDSNSTTDDASETIVVTSSDLVTVKTVSNATPNEGDTIVYTIAVTNSGPSDATGVSLTDLLPSGVTYVSDDQSGAYNRGSGIWRIGNILDGTTATLNITALVDVDTSGTTITNSTSAATGDQSDPTTAGDILDATINVENVADIVLTKVVDNNNPNVGDTVTYTVTVTNNGSAKVTSLVVTDVLPSGLTYGIVSPSDGTWTAPNWSVGTLESGEEETIVIEAVVGMDQGGNTLINTASNSQDQVDSNSTPDDASEIIVVTSSDLVTVKTVSNATPNEGDTIVYTIAVTNSGSDATGVSLTDLLPQGVTYVSDDQSGAYNSGSGIWTIGNILDGTTATLNITALVDVDTSGTTITNSTSAATGDQSDPTTDGDILEATIGVENFADIVLTKVVDNAKPNVGDIVTYTITVTNNGPSKVTNLVVTDALPAGLTYANVMPSDGIWTAPNWQVDLLESGEFETIVIEAVVGMDQGGMTLTNIVSNTQDQVDSNLTEDDDRETIVVTSSDLVTVKTVSNATPNEGDTIIYTIAVTNNGPSIATNVSLIDNLPVGVTFVSHSAAEGTYNYGSGLWSIGNLANGATAMLNITATVDDGTLGQTITNTTSVVTADQSDSDTTNNVGTVSIVPTAYIDLSLTKSVVNDVVDPEVGDIITFEIRVNNDGPTEATGVQVKDLIPSGYDFVNYSSSIGTYNPITGLWNIGFIEIGNTAVLLVDVIVMDSGDYINCAEITAANELDIDSTPGNANSSEDDYDCASAPPYQELDLKVEKTIIANNLTPMVGTEVSFEIRLINDGIIEGTEVVVTDLLPTGYTFLNYSSTRGAYDDDSGKWMVGTIVDGETEVLVIDAIINATGDYLNCATITEMHQTDTDLSNNTSCIATDPIKVADLELTKEVELSDPNLGTVSKTGVLQPYAETNVDFTITLTNNGPSDATGVQVNDLLPNGYNFVSASTSIGSYDDGSGIWDVGTVLNGSSETLVITAYVNPMGDWVNIAEVIAVNELDLDSTPNNGDIFEDDMDQIATAPIVPLTVPEGFSPNGDGINDLFEIEFLQILYPNFGLEIVDRYGNLVYKYKHNGDPYQTPEWWDGFSSGKANFSSDQLPAGTYFYTIYFNNNERKPQTGWVYLRK